LGVARRSRAVETLGGLLWKRRADVPWAGGTFARRAINFLLLLYTEVRRIRGRVGGSYLRASRVSCGRGAGGGCAFVRPAVLTLGSRTTWSERSLQGAESAQRAPYTSVAHFAAKTEQALFRRYGLTPSVGCGREGLRFDIQTALDTRETDLGVARRSRAVETLGGLLWKRRADVPCP
jgi:hypothetical protein